MVLITSATLGITLATLAAPAVAHLISHDAHAKHHQLAERLEEHFDDGNRTLVKRWQYNNVRATWYDAGLGACGKVNKASDFIVALNTPQMKELGSGWPSKQCWKTITISYGGKTAEAEITDECPPCPYGGLDFSEGLFSYFADTGKGVLAVDWSFNDGSGGSSGSSNNNNNNNDDDGDKSWQSRSSVSAKSILSTRSEASEASVASVASRSRETQRSLEAESSRTWASIASESRESRASISSVSVLSSQSVRSELSVASTASTASVVSASLAAYISTAEIPIETAVTLNSVKDADANNLGVAHQAVLNFGNLAAIGRT